MPTRTREFVPPSDDPHYAHSDGFTTRDVISVVTVSSLPGLTTYDVLVTASIPDDAATGEPYSEEYRVTVRGAVGGSAHRAELLTSWGEPFMVTDPWRYGPVFSREWAVNFALRREVK